MNRQKVSKNPDKLFSNAYHDRQFIFLDSELTSWETYNYIIHGFVNELIQLGCKDELALTTLQLWSAYLRKNEVAFFGKKETKIPKFSFKYNQR